MNHQQESLEDKREALETCRSFLNKRENILQQWKLWYITPEALTEGWNDLEGDIINYLFTQEWYEYGRGINEVLLELIVTISVEIDDIISGWGWWGNGWSWWGSYSMWGWYSYCYDDIEDEKRKRREEEKKKEWQNKQSQNNRELFEAEKEKRMQQINKIREKQAQNKQRDTSCSMDK